MFVLYIARDKRRPQEYDIGSKLCLELIDLMALDDIEVIECGPYTTVPQWLVGTPTIYFEDEIITGSAAVSFLQHMAVQQHSGHRRAPAKNEWTTRSMSDGAATLGRKSVNANEYLPHYTPSSSTTTSTASQKHNIRPSLQLRPATHRHSVSTSNASAGEDNDERYAHNDIRRRDHSEYHTRTYENERRDHNDSLGGVGADHDTQEWIKSIQEHTNNEAEDDDDESKKTKLSHNDFVRVLQQKNVSVPQIPNSSSSS